MTNVITVGTREKVYPDTQDRNGQTHKTEPDRHTDGDTEKDKARQRRTQTDN